MIHSSITSSLHCSDEDLPRTNNLFTDFERAGITADELSPHTLLKIAGFAIREHVSRGHMVPRDAPEVYSRIDTIVSATIGQTAIEPVAWIPDQAA